MPALAAPVLIPAITGAGMTAATLYGAKRASDTARRAGETQSVATDRAAALQTGFGREALGVQERLAREALGVQRDMWEQAQQQAQPWMQAGRSALGAITGLTGLSSEGGGRGLAGLAGYQGPTFVNMKAPDGSVRPVPRTMVEHYRSRGAEVVQ